MSCFIGLMSGTSLDGVDGVLARFPDDPAQHSIRVLAHAHRPFAQTLRGELLELNHAGDNELHRAALAANQLARVQAEVVQALLSASGQAAGDVAAIGSHGQTLRHRPGEFDGTGYTIQINQPALLAEATGICVIADFRSRDVAAGGQGAPLVPAFHAQVFSLPDAARAVLNLGGIGNLTLLPPAGDAAGMVRGFDCGPGNALLDHWVQRHQGRPFDDDGRWAAGGHVLPALLGALLSEPFLARRPPKSTGRDLFNAGWLAGRLAGFEQAAPQDVQATLAEFTARAAAEALRREATGITDLRVCGGGALNAHLMARLAALLPGIGVGSTADAGLPPLQVEAAAFAWLARACLLGQPGNRPEATGARGPRVLGAVYPA
ncbi:anhydro-N-acetylmuramic acid kinase [Ideonella sp.]|uniref:anhydro-N-acetylmuramic acid kinase n=1 Tax=Ideonella sp. TaxID=1929293 RepID=UPI002B47925C|nr:anhydro-N-acetylmuramic acid kinase [Ideonella sp.]HJV70147.1 anhydro-N-acetylmuramic acid kinase [Ideonella sp.]